jgi:glycosyltransferase involved in cell wall biosynthesis
MTAFDSSQPAAEYTAIVPRADRAGPCNVAVDLCRQALSAGFRVRLLFLSDGVQRDDLGEFHDVRRLRWRDFFQLRGIIHTHCLRPDVVGALFTIGKRRSVVTTLHNYFLIDNGFDHAAWKTRLSYRVWTRCISRFDARVTISNAMNRYYRRLLPHVTFDTAYNFRGVPVTPIADPAPDIRRFVESHKAAGRLVMVFVGVLSRRKNILPLAEVVACSQKLALVICGTGLLEPELAAVAARSSNLHLAGHCNDPRSVLRACHMLVLPSRAEGMPLVVLEALMCGRASLLSNIAVHRELAHRGVGATFDHRLFSNLERQAAAVAAHAAQIGELGLEGLFEREFSPRQGFARYQAIFAGLKKRSTA